MVQFAKIMEYPIAVTEQYSRGLGKTIEELADAREFVLSDKTQFSMMTPEVTAFMEEHKPRYYTSVKSTFFTFFYSVTFLCAVSKHTLVFNVQLAT